MEQLNTSQLRNLWLRSPDERLAGWREFRIQLQAAYAGCDGNALPCLEAISTWWQQVPEVSVAIDPYNPDNWPTIWEIIYQGECCKYSKGLAMAYNMHYMDQDADVNLHRVRDHKFGDEYMVAELNGLALNSLHDIVVNLHSVEFLEIRETFDIRSRLLQNQQ